MRIDFSVDSAKADALLRGVEQAGLELRPVMLQIGEYLTDATKQRFQTGVAPDGKRWAPNAMSTILNYLSKFSGNYGKDGRLNAKGANRVMGKRPLIGESRSLSRTINYRTLGNAVEVGSPMEYAPVQQFGAKKGAFGVTRRGSPIPWADIPARPFLGVSREDWIEIENILEDYLVDAA